MRHHAGCLVLALVGACANDDGGAEGADGSSSGSTSGDATSVSATSVTATTATTTATTATTSATTTGETTGVDTSTDEGPADTTAAGDCPSDAMAAGQYNAIDVDFDGMTRSYNLYIPAGVDGSEPIPLVLNFHGYTSNAGQQQLFSVMDPVADAHGFAVAYPEGLDSSWNAGLCCGTSAQNGVDDVGFALAVIDDVKTRACIDGKRVYATGMSNGGFMSYRLACEASDSIAAVAPVAGVLGLAQMDCAPSRPVPVMHFHGTADPLVPYDGGNGFPSVPDTVAFFGMLDGCQDDPANTFAMDDVHCEARMDCDEGSMVELCTVDGGGHCWPGNDFCPFGTSTTTINASDRMAEFFANYTLP